MSRSALILTICSLSVISLATSCGPGVPYIFKQDEFNRAAPNFNKTLKDRKNIKICYNNASINPRELKTMAQKECSIYGKVAIFEKEDFLHCPMFTPSGATFLCVEP